jgi:hypothetical protein
MRAICTPVTPLHLQASRRAGISAGTHHAVPFMWSHLCVETYGHLGKLVLYYLRTLSDIALARSLAVTWGSLIASAHRELSVPLVQSQGYVFRSFARVLIQGSGQ